LLKVFIWVVTPLSCRLSDHLEPTARKSYYSLLFKTNDSGHARASTCQLFATD
jgi:hypothetical protein